MGAFRAGELRDVDWSLTDHELLSRLLGSSMKQVRETVNRWAVGELWDLTPLCWMGGSRPSYPTLLDFSLRLSDEFQREYQAYGITDKRARRINVRFAGESATAHGHMASQWLLGVASPARKAFTRADVQQVFSCAAKFFNTPVIGEAIHPLDRLTDTQPSLL